MKKFVEFCKRPITWGGYLKLCGVSGIVSVLLGIVMGKAVGVYIDNYLNKINED